LNSDKKIVLVKETDPWGLVYENGAITGALGKVANGEAQIAIGSLYLLSERAAVAYSSTPYYSYPEVFVISPARKLTNFEKLLQPFDVWIWILILLTLLTAFLVIFIINQKFPQVKSFVFGTEVHDPELNVLNAVLGGSQSKLPKKNFSRFLLMKFLIFCLILRNAYQGALFKHIQSEKRLRNPQSIEELADQKYDLLLFNLKRSLELFINHPKIYSR
jgi:ABC-type amino acid transport substrate-binding protein